MATDTALYNDVIKLESLFMQGLKDATRLRKRLEKGNAPASLKTKKCETAALDAMRSRQRLLKRLSKNTGK